MYWAIECITWNGLAYLWPEQKIELLRVIVVRITWISLSSDEHSAAGCQAWWRWWFRVPSNRWHDILHGICSIRMRAPRLDPIWFIHANLRRTPKLCIPGSSSTYTAAVTQFVRARIPAHWAEYAVMCFLALLLFTCGAHTLANSEHTYSRNNLYAQRSTFKYALHIFEVAWISVARPLRASTTSISSWSSSLRNIYYLFSCRRCAVCCVFVFVHLLVYRHSSFVMEIHTPKNDYVGSWFCVQRATPPFEFWENAEKKIIYKHSAFPLP